ncbi:MAG: PA2779 family protein [Thermodesulfobacteriota bacterium]
MNKSGMSGWKAVLAAIAFAFVSAPVSADIVSTQEVVLTSDREQVRAFLEREGVEERLKALGVAPELARTRLDAMTDEEILLVAGRIDTLPAGGALDKTDWILILLLVILVLVLI